MKTSLVAAAAAAAIALSAASAQAGCVQAKAKPGSVHKVSSMPEVASLEGTVPANDTTSDSIVGLWKVTHYDQNRNLYFDGLEQWHSDGTEFELGNVPPAIGNICLGVWKSIALKRFQLSHVGLDFTPDGDSDGIFTLTATVRLNNKGDKFSGTEDVKIYDAGGHLVQEVPGTIAGKRISVQ